MAKVKL